MNRLPGILKIIFVILILVTGGELGYYLYFQFTNQTNTASSRPAETTTINIANLVASPVPTFALNDPNRAVNTRMVLDLLRPRKGILISSVVTNAFQGELVELDTKGGVTQNNFQYAIKLKIKGENNNINQLYFTDKELNKLNVRDTLNSLKIGDKIILKLTLDLLKDFESNLIDFSVSKI